MLSAKLSAYATERYEARRNLLESVMPTADAAIAACASEDERTLMRYLYGTLPVTDCLDTTPEVLLGYVRHALFLRREVSWTRELGEGAFAHYVLCPRVNTEPLTDCRHTFWELLRERVASRDPYDAVREVNYWCCERATYQTTDGRTLGPLAVLASGNGRCGEESTFLVTALRSVGIPARQIYTPWWAHCDDNHAWVEAFTGDGWHYLGACEPEGELDRGWFTNAAGRALMEETRLFSDYRDESVPEQSAGAAGSMEMLNVTSSYAQCSELSIHVVRDGDLEAEQPGARLGEGVVAASREKAAANPGQVPGTAPDNGPAEVPTADAAVMIEILNTAGWQTAAALVTDAQGRATQEVGAGTLRVWASAEELVGYADVDTRTEHEVTVRLAKPEDALARELAGWHDLDVDAPADNPAPSRAQTPEQEAQARTRKTACDEIRRKRVAGWQAEAARLAQRWPGSEHAFAYAFANAPEVATFLSVDDEPDRLELLGTLTDKDFRDIHAGLLESHLAHARSIRARVEAGLREQSLSAEDAHRTYVSYVLCPRTSYEELSDYRPAILGYFGEDLQSRFRSDPHTLWAWLCDRLSFDSREGLARPIGMPATALASGIGSEATRSHVFVATCRALGVPARLNPESGHPEFMEHGSFVPVEETVAPATSRAVLSLDNSGENDEPSVQPTYYSSWTLGKLEHYVAANCREAYGFRTLDLEGVSFNQGELELKLTDGLYRLVTTTRLPSGNQLASERVFRVNGGNAARVSRADMNSAATTPSAEAAHAAAATRGSVLRDATAASHASEDSAATSLRADESDAATDQGADVGEDRPSLRISLRHRSPSANELLNPIELFGFALSSGEGTPCQPALGSRAQGILAFLQPGMEPTEHLLNELRERAEAVRDAGLGVTLIVRSRDALADPTLRRTLAALPEARIAFDSFTELPERLARRTYVNPELLPLALLVRDVAGTNLACNGESSASGPRLNSTDTSASADSASDKKAEATPGTQNARITSLYATAGYNVGTVDLLLCLSQLN